MSTIVLLVVVAYLAFDRWQARRIVDRAASIIECGSPDLKAMIELVDRLAQRLQAPGVAVAEHTATILPVEAPQHVPMDDDDAFWLANISKEDLARKLAEDDFVRANGGT